MRGDRILRADPFLAMLRDHMRNSVGAAVPQPVVRLQPGDDFTVFDQPLFSGQQTKIFGGLSCLSFDAVEISLKCHGFLPTRFAVRRLRQVLPVQPIRCEADK